MDKFLSRIALIDPAEQYDKNLLSPLGTAAMLYAKANLPVFPLIPRGKYPLIPKRLGGNGLHDATTDSKQIAKWWAKSPNANIGIRTGVHEFTKDKALFVIDIDSDKEHQNNGFLAMTTLADRHGPEWLDTYSVQTPSGGLHLYYWLDASIRLRNTQDVLGLGIDTRSDDGQIVAAPSVREDGAYTIREGALLAIAEAPRWAVQKLVERERKREEVAMQFTDFVVASQDQASRALQDACNELRQNKGGINSELHRKAYAIGGYVGAGMLSFDEAFRQLAQAAVVAGMPSRSASYTANRSLKEGARHPFRQGSQSRAATTYPSQQMWRTKAPTTQPEAAKVV
ncbi:bifunctional DNA primase/polymerase [Ferrimicrobium acidiphilum]|uniref:bifunctional DNA primase/polymerase n=1 Tax=Ferrimicrobium acidiphilum TaxID=121039 RepID=UPI0023F2CAE9|nr:bifunctional DNA primase/polymerase [Ferrimicrobium acidiphilum]